MFPTMADSPAVITCRLCADARASRFCTDRSRDYYRCPTCGLTLVPTGQFLSPDEEKRRYDLHENSPDDPGYRKFLGRVFAPLHERLPGGSRGLDFGSGPGPALSVMFAEVGHVVATYDRFYAPDPSPLRDRYDFITATEVAEHLHDPGVELDRLWAILKPGGWLGLMTRPAPDAEAFATWRYKDDLTHVCFFAPETFRWLAERWGAELIRADYDVALFRKKN
jgi:hypothetical protein